MPGCRGRFPGWPEGKWGLEPLIIRPFGLAPRCRPGQPACFQLVAYGCLSKEARSRGSFLLSSFHLLHVFAQLSRISTMFQGY